MAQNSLHINDKSIFSNFMAIIPANRKVRIYNFREGYVDAIVKDTYTHKFFNNELSFRLNNKYDFVLPIMKHGGSWYRERILSGQPLARITNDAMYQKCVEETVKYIGIISEKTLEYVDVSDYVNSLYDEILLKMSIIKDKKEINCYDTIIEISDKASNIAKLLNMPIPTVQSHGDLQSGNVWVNTKIGKVYIIDWETYGRRSIWYDCATLLLETRRANKLKEMMYNRNKKEVQKAILKNDKFKDYNMLSVLAILTLEDIIFHIDDMLGRPGVCGSDFLNNVVREIYEMGWADM